jgi:FAD/FMN-containing dehydrogenase
MPNSASIQELSNQIQGQVLSPQSAAYDEARKVWNGMIDRKPALIVRCAASNDVAACVQFARAESLSVSVRGGGHNFAGRAVADGALMIDLSPMKRITIDPGQATARAQTGLKLGEFDRETQKHGLVTPLGVATTTGISGLTLGGGYGWLIGKYGLACDNVLSMQVVTAEGNTLHCSATDNRELFWGMRGAGANFGIATQIEYRLHPLARVLGGPLFFALSADVMRRYADFTAGIPDELTTFAAAAKLPDGTPVFAVVACYCGAPAVGEKLIAPLRSWAKPLVDMLQVRPYLEMQSLFDADYPAGRRYYNKSHNVRTLNAGVIGTVLKYSPSMPPRPSSIGFQQMHGAATRVPIEETAFPHRYSHDVVWVSPVEDDPAQDVAMVEWTRRCWEALLPDVDQAVYVNTLDGTLEDGEQRIRQAYGVNYPRLQALKKLIDPTNLFSLNSNIRPD